MTVTLNLDAEEVRALTAEAEAQSVGIETVLHRLVARLSHPADAPPGLSGTQMLALARLASQSSGNDRMTPDELAESDTEFAEMQANISRWRAE